MPGDDNQFAINADGKINARMYWDQVKGEGTPDPTHQDFLCVRHINMSVIWIMRIL